MNIHKPMQLLIMAAFVAACGGEGGGGGDDTGSRGGSITIEEPTNATTYRTESRFMMLSGRAFIANELPDFCLGLN